VNNYKLHFTPYDHVVVAPYTLIVQAASMGAAMIIGLQVAKDSRKRWIFAKAEQVA
jgi:hypothetical protein